MKTLSKIVLLVGALAAFNMVATSCSDDSERQAEQERDKRNAEREAREKEEAAKKAETPIVQPTDPPLSDPSPEPSPDASPEPDMETVLYFTSASEHTAVRCKSTDWKMEPCGITFQDCDNHSASYYCQTAVKAWENKEEVKN